MGDLERIERMLQEGRTDEVITMLDGYIASAEVPSDKAYYLLGNAYRKKGDWQGAINNYLEAIAINPDGPAAGAYRMANDILDFYNKDMYNQ